ncbi:hypothetical protein IE994_12270 [Enterobacter hormaechei]|uniref:Transposase n=1 Tax=Enterobacter hormaechei TaxID=158836 RepID=A0A927DHN9_9ENTR|nr:hypothetical protein [Enterobacter hormaechei]MBD3717102.1 hypothetical protein [Enterobacter hormaechei]
MKEKSLRRGYGIAKRRDRRQLPEDLSYWLIQNEKNPLIERVLKFC